MFLPHSNESMSGVMSFAWKSGVQLATLLWLVEWHKAEPSLKRPCTDSNTDKKKKKSHQRSSDQFNPLFFTTGSLQKTHNPTAQPQLADNITSWSTWGLSAHWRVLHHYITESEMNFKPRLSFFFSGPGGIQILETVWGLKQANSLPPADFLNLSRYDWLHRARPPMPQPLRAGDRGSDSGTSSSVMYR